MPLRPPAGFVSSFYDPLKNPNAPTVGTASAGDTQASVTFTAPSNVGGSAITNYYAVSNPGQITASSVTSPVTVTGLTNGTNYTFTVWALNSFGPSAYSAASGSVTPSPPYIEEVFQTWLYTGDGAMTITNGIDLAGKGGMVWAKNRDSAQENWTFNSAIGTTQPLSTNLTASAATNISNYFGAANLCVFNSNGFSFANQAQLNSSNKYASWTFRKQPKFFDVVTYTGNGTAGRTVAHSLGSVPGCIIIKQTSASGQGWPVYHRSEGSGRALLLNDTAASFLASGYWSNTTPTSTQFTLGSSAAVNENGQTYVAYLFAHDAGGFGLTGTDNVISCGSFTTDSSGYSSVNLGWEPQFVLVKPSSTSGNWVMLDNMRGMPASTGSGATGNSANQLFPNLSIAEQSDAGYITNANSTGFTWHGSSGYAGVFSYIYIAIRRGPMKTPTTGTSVFEPQLTTTPPTTGNTYTSSLYTVDGLLQRHRDNAVNWSLTPRLTNRILMPSAANAEFTTQYNNFGAVQSGVSWVANWSNDAGNYINYWLRRAPGFFDVVCYTGTGSATTQAHNLGVVPELMIVKKRNGIEEWPVYSTATGNTSWLVLNSATSVSSAARVWNNTTPTSSVFTVGTGQETNESGKTYVAYLFATVSGVSKVGSYTGTGALQTINCGFTGGARFVLIKRTDDTGDWFVYDSARGITSSNDPYLFLNSTAAEVTNTNYVDTDSTGFKVTAAAPAGLNANGGTFVFLAIS
jgi:hypothetical protein